MTEEKLQPAVAPRRPPIVALELVLVTVLALGVLLPGVWRYSLVDPWETHYGEVGRRMLQDEDWVHTQWQNEGFRSKPVLTFWLMAASMKALDVADDGGYSGELVASDRTVLAIRLPFVLFGVLGLVAMWWMLARLISRRVAYLALLVLATTPFYALVARQGITDMTLVGAMVGAIAMFAVAAETGDEPLRPLWRIGRVRSLAIDHRHVLAVIVGAFLLWQALYYLFYFQREPQLGIRPPPVPPGVLLAFPIIATIALLIALEVAPVALRPVRQVIYWLNYGLYAMIVWVVGRIFGARWPLPPPEAEIATITTKRQIYLLWFWVFLGLSVLGKGLPALGIVGIVCAFYVLLLGKWSEFWNDRYELWRGLVLIVLIAAPWHVAMYFKDGQHFLQEYFVTHLWNRAAIGVHGDRGTFDFYLSQVGYGMFVWAALVPAALAALVLRTRLDSAAGRARFVVAIWAITSVAFFSVVQTKFHHYILPAIPALAIAVACWLDDVLAGRARYRNLAAVTGIAIVLLITNDLIVEPELWIEMFIYRYDRPWPADVDAADGFLALGLAATGALLLLRLRRVGVVAICVVGLAAGLWSIHAYMPVAAQHWGMRDAIRQYYEERTIHGAHLVYWGNRRLADDWDAGHGVRDTWTLRTLVPHTVQEGDPVTIRITVKSNDDKRTEQALRLPGRVERVDVDGAAIHVRLAATDALNPLIERGRSEKRSNRDTIRAVDADRLIAWQLYWRGENFWTGDEIWFQRGRLPEMQTAFKDTDNVKFKKYLGDRELAPEGRRYWVITESGRAKNLEVNLPTVRAKDTFRIENTASNKFTLTSFHL